MPILGTTITVNGTNLVTEQRLITLPNSGSRIPVQWVGFQAWLEAKFDLNHPTQSALFDAIGGDARAVLRSNTVLRQLGPGPAREHRITEATLVTFGAEFRTSLKALARSFVSDCISPQLGNKQDSATTYGTASARCIDTLVNDGKMPERVRKLGQMTPGALSAQAKGLVVTQAITFCESVQRGVWQQWLKCESEGKTPPTKGGTPDLPDDSTACEVWVKRANTTWAAVGAQTNAVRGTPQARHAEMLWKRDYEDDFDTAIGAGATAVEFHITRIPCDDGNTCAKALVTWWQGRAARVDKAFIFTHSDDYPQKKNVYRLNRDALVKVGTWA
jgi:hypothetical protein